MNRSTLNGVPLGNGGNDPRSFVSMALSAIATLSMGIYARRSFSAFTQATASSSPRFDALYSAAAATTARVTSVITTSLYYAKYVTSNVLAVASSVLTAYRIIQGAGSLTGLASLIANWIYGTTWTASTTAQASSTAHPWVLTEGPADITCTATDSAPFVLATLASAATTAQATSTLAVIKTGFAASPERQMAVAPEDRIMRVS